MPWIIPSFGEYSSCRLEGVILFDDRHRNGVRKSLYRQDFCGAGPGSFPCPRGLEGEACCVYTSLGCFQIKAPGRLCRRCGFIQIFGNRRDLCGSWVRCRTIFSAASVRAPSPASGHSAGRILSRRSGAGPFRLNSIILRLWRQPTSGSWQNRTAGPRYSGGTARPERIGDTVPSVPATVARCAVDRCPVRISG